MLVSEVTPDSGSEATGAQGMDLRDQSGPNMVSD